MELQNGIKGFVVVLVHYFKLHWYSNFNCKSHLASTSNCRWDVITCEVCCLRCFDFF